MSTSARSDVVLLVEDDPTCVEFLRRAFGALGVTHGLQIACDGEEATAYLAGEGAWSDRVRFPLPSLIVTDLRLPRKSGFDLIEWIRARPGLRRIPVVVLSGSQNPADIDHAYDVGANSYIVAPLLPADYSEAVRRMRDWWLGLCLRPSLDL